MFINDGSIDYDEQGSYDDDDYDASERDAMAAFKKRIQDARKLSETAEKEGTQERKATPPQEPREENDDVDEYNLEEDHEDEPALSQKDPTPGTPIKMASPDDEVIVKVDGEERRVTVKDLSRLYGQEQALTKKSQAASQIAKDNQVRADALEVAFSELLNKAEERLKPYKELNLFALSKSMSAEELAYLEQNKKEREAEVEFLNSKLGEFLHNRQIERNKSRFEAGREALRQINDPKHANHIPDWSDEVYDGLRNYAVSQGMDAQVFNDTTDAVSIKILWKAAQFEKVTEELNKLKASPPAPTSAKKSLTPGTSDNKADGTRQKSLLDRAKRTGNEDDVARAWKARIQTSRN